MSNNFHQKKVSVIIPTYNRAQFLRCAMESTLNQTFKDIEIIVSDDNSTDHTREVVRGFKDARIKYIRHENNKGVSAARNAAIKAAKGEYIAFLDDDDEWLPEKLQRQVELMDKCPPIVCGVYSNRLIKDKLNNRVISEKPFGEKLSGNLLYQLAIVSPIHTSTVLIRKECINKIGLFDTSISYMEDRDMWIRLSEKWDFKYINEPLTIANMHNQGHLSESLEGQTAGREKLIERYYHLFKKNRKNMGKLYTAQASQYCQLKKMKKGRRNMLKSIKVYPFSLKPYLQFVSSYFGPSVYNRLRNRFKTTG